MKTLLNFCEQNNLLLVHIKYRFQGMRLRRKGFDIVRPNDKTILFSFEPENFTHSKIKWFVRVSPEGYTKGSHINRITKDIFNGVNLDCFTGYKLTT